MLDQLREGDRRTLAKCITLIESRRPEDRAAANELLEKILPDTGNSLRIGISGIPGVGKSTFIETFGLHLIEQGNRVAVLAVDPTSPVAGGSILGDKTRMTRLARSDQAYIRPSPSSGVLGGTSARTRETMLLCEAAGYNIILIETVGVGQIEVDVHDMVDFFMVLMVPNAGDELQGIKRGITELVDCIVINKADGASAQLARQAQGHYQNALAILRDDDSGWKPRVLTCSSTEETGISEIGEMISIFHEQFKEDSRFANKRQQQYIHWFDTLVKRGIEQRLLGREDTLELFSALEDRIANQEITPMRAAEEFLEEIFGDFQSKNPSA